jgi:cytochrome c oxidase subunit 4
MAGHIVPKKTYWTVFAALMVFLVLTVAVANFHLVHELAIGLALTIAIIKAVLVILFFMHVKYSSKLTWVFVGAGFFWFLIMVTLTFGDYISRGWLPGQ